MDNSRFKQLLQLATGGDCAAIADLWHEFQFDFYSESALCGADIPVCASNSSSAVSAPLRDNNPSAPALCSSVLSVAKNKPVAPPSAFDIPCSEFCGSSLLSGGRSC